MDVLLCGKKNNDKGVDFVGTCTRFYVIEYKMSNRKENLKKSLGITEYPWSSDEDENANPQPTQDDNAVRRPPDSRPTVADFRAACGRVSPTSQGAAARKQQARLDRTMFWSIINTAGSSTSPVNRSRVNDAPVTHVPRNINLRNAAADLRASADHLRERRQAHNDRSNAPSDIQRILAFKKLTRSLQNFANNKPGSNVLFSSPRRLPGSSTRSGLFAPSALAAAAANARARANSNFSRTHLNRSPFSGYSRHSSPAASGSDHNDILTVDDPQPSSSGIQFRSMQVRQAPSELDTAQPMQEDYVNVVDQSDDEVEAVQESAPIAEQSDENNGDDENAEGTTPNTSAGCISLEEEIVEVDVPDVNDGAPTADAETDTADVNITTEATPSTSNAVEVAETPRQQTPFQGVKRKRDANEDNAEAFSVQEFNQSLLRLLECPVCLEWMEPPISQCRRGHLVCSRCRTRLASCPVCRTTFSSVRNRAMEGVAEMLRYPCRHGCGREVRLRRRGPHEASCGARRYHCPAQPCARHPPLPHQELAHHFQCKHLPILKIGRKHKFSMKVNSEQHDTWLIMALDEYFHLRVDVDIRTWGVIVYVAYIGPKRKARNYTYEVIVEGQHNSRSLKYARATHSDLESSSLNVSRQDCFHLTLDQALNFLRFKNRHCEPDKFLDFDVEISKCQNINVQDSKDESD